MSPTAYALLGLGVLLVLLLFGPGTFLGRSRRADGRRRSNVLTSPATGQPRRPRRKRPGTIARGSR